MSFPHEIGVRFVCPLCRSEVLRDGDGFVCAGEECRRRYPIVDGIPKFLIDDAEVLPEADWRQRIQVHDRPENNA